jgi:hypothetical protein
MSEPRAEAKSIETLVPGVTHYHLDDERIATRSDAYVVASREGAILIDPLPLAVEEFGSIGSIAAIVLTTPHHQRSAWRLRRAIDARIHAPRGSTGLLEIPDLEYADGDLLPGGLQAVHAPGPDPAHHVLHLAVGPGLLFLGDLLLRQADGVVRHLHPDYLPDPEGARRSLRRILERSFDTVAFGHGEAIHSGGRAALAEVAALDAAAGHA